MSREKVFVGQGIRELKSSPDWGSYSKVILKTADGEGYVAGDDSGITLEADCPYATQAVADAVLASLQGSSYKPYDGAKAYITPAAELGDGMTSDGFYSGIYSLSRQFSKVSAADIAAPSNTEVRHEIQYVSESERKFARKMKEISAEFAVMADEISAKVSEVGGNNQSFGWSMTTAGMYWYANGQQVMSVNQNGLEVQGKIKASSEIEAGSLTIAGVQIQASTLRSGADSGYSWANGSYGGTTPWSYSLTGGGYGFNYNTATTSGTTDYPQNFTCSRLRLMSGLYFAGYDWGSQTININGRNYVVMVGQQ